MALIIFQLPGIEKAMNESGEKILTPLVSLDTPGKATVQVVILGDPVCSLISFLYNNYNYKYCYTVMFVLSAK